MNAADSFRTGDKVVDLAEFPPYASTLPLFRTEETDELLVTAALSGDPYAFVELSNRHSRRLLLKIYRMTNNWQDAEDILQESLMRAFTQLYTFESRASFATWLTRIAINSALMLLRKKRRCRTLSSEALMVDNNLGEALDPRDHRENPEQICARRQAEEKLQKAMQRIRPIYRQVIELRGDRELQMSEIARSLRISQAAVKSRLMRARKELRRQIQ